MGIVWLILKILGITLLVILLIVLLLLAALLFCAFKYEVEAAGDKDGPQADATVRVRWLFRIVSFRYIFKLTPDGSGNENGYILKVFGIPVKKAITKAGEKKDEETSETEKPKDDSAGKDETSESAKEDGKPKEEKPKEEAVTAEENSLSVKTDEPDGKPEEAAGKPEEKAEETEAKPDETAEEAEAKPEETDGKPAETDETAEASEEESGSPYIDGPDKPKKKLGEKIGELKDKITGKVSGLIDSLHALLILLQKKKGLLAAYIKKKSTKKAIKTAWVTLVWVLKHICPKKYRGSLTFGLEDPALTGEICAAISPWYILIADKVALTPAFEGKLVASGDIYLKGRIRLWGFVVRAIKLYRDKNIRKVIKEAEKVKETLVATPDEAKEIFTSAA